MQLKDDIGIFNSVVPKLQDDLGILSQAPSKPSFIKDVVVKSAKDLGMQGVATVESALSLGSGMALSPIAKAWGVANLPWGAEAAKKAEERLLSLGYQPKTKEAQEAMELVGKGFEVVLKPAEMAGKAVEPYSPRAAYLVNLGAELAEFAMMGGFAKKVKPAKPESVRVVKGKAIEDAPIKKDPLKPPEPIAEGVGTPIEGELPKYAGSVNLEKQAIPTEMKQLEVDLMADVPKKTRTWEQSLKMADELMKDQYSVAKIMEKAKGGEGLSGVEIDVARKVNVKELAHVMTMKDLPEAEFTAAVKNYKENILTAVSDASSEAGRALNIHKRVVGPEAIANAFKKLERDLNPRELKELKDLNIEDPVQVKQFIDRLGDPKVKDYFMEYWYNAILSGPPTHLVNTISNTGWLAFQVPHRALTAGVDKIYSKLTGKERVRYMNEIVPMLAGYKEGAVRGAKLAGTMLKEGRIKGNPLDSKWALEMERAAGAFERSPNKVLQKAAPLLTAPTRALRAMDVWANSIAYDAHARVLARRESNRKGLTGESRKLFEEDYIKRLPDEAHQDAMKQARYSTFMDEPDPATAWLIKGRQIPVVGTVYQFVVPFVNTISNLTKRGLEMTPGVGILKEAVSRKMGRGSPTPEVIAKQIEGAIISYFLLNKAEEGKITGAAPDRDAEREAFYREGKLPWSVKIGDSWHQYRRMEPFNTVLASAAIAHDTIRNAKDDESAADAFLTLTNGVKDNLIDSSYFQGIQQLFDKYGSGKHAIERFAASWVPYSGFWRSVNRAYEVATEGKTTVKDKPGGGRLSPDSWLAAFAQVVPGLSGKVPARLNVWGEEIEIPGGIFRQWLPYKWSEQSGDPVEKELAEIELYPGIPNKKYKYRGEDREMTDDQHRDFVVYYGSRLKDEFAKTIMKESYQKYDKERRLDILDKRLTIIRMRTKAKFISRISRKNHAE